VHVETEYEKRESILTGNLVFHLRNSNPETVTVTVADNSYKTGTISRRLDPGYAASVVLRLKGSHGWYDFTVKTDGSDAEARLAGRVETGRPSLIDPLIAGIV
jgi:phospholipase C